MPVEINRDASFKELRALLGRWMNAEPDNVSSVKKTMSESNPLNYTPVVNLGNFQPQILQESG